MPPELIAQTPAAQRDSSRLLVYHRTSRQVQHRRFTDLLQYLGKGDVLVLNDSRVIPARLRGLNPLTGGHFELLLVEEIAPNDWWAMIRPGKRARLGTRIVLLDWSGHPSDVAAKVVATNAEGHRRLVFEGEDNILSRLDRLGEVPLPPYIQRSAGESSREDRERYQTVFAQAPGSVAAPTAGLHFTPSLLNQIRAIGVEVCRVTLHVGLGTFAPMKSDTVAEHTMHEERYEVGGATAEILRRAKAEQRRIVAVGTTTLRVLESLARDNPAGITEKRARTRLFIYPPYQFKMVDVLLTNFHLPRSTLLMLVSAFAAPGAKDGREAVLSAYAEAIRERYRFFSYGDAMLLI